MNYEKDEYREEHIEKPKIVNVNETTVYEIFPNSSATNAIKILLSSDEEGNVRTLKNTKIVKNEFYTETQYNFSSRNSSITLSIEKYNNLFAKQDTKTKKIFNFLLQQYNQQGKTNEINFHLNELVERGIYKNTDCARKGIKKCLSKLMSIRVAGNIKKGKKEILSTMQVLFIGLEIKKGLCTVNINDKFDMNFIVQYFTIMPSWTYKLTTSAYDVVDYIFYRARQSINEIKEYGSFNIRIDTISRHINQPDPRDTERHTQLIIKPLLNAIEEINDAYSNKNNIKISTQYDENSKDVKEFLNSCIKVELNGDLTQYFIERAIDKEKEVIKKLK